MGYQGVGCFAGTLKSVFPPSLPHPYCRIDTLTGSLKLWLEVDILGAEVLQSRLPKKQINSALRSVKPQI
jgi:hypothetical protein